MHLTGKEDLRVRRTIESIKRSFEEQIMIHDYEDITVKSVCDGALINKKTFYTYYHSLDDLLAELQAELSAGYLDLVKDMSLPDEIERVNRTFFEYNEKQSKAYEKITCSGNYTYIRQQMINHVVQKTWGTSKKFKALSKEEQNLILAYANACAISIYRQWVQDGRTIPLEQVIELSNTLMNHGMAAFFQKK